MSFANLFASFFQKTKTVNQFWEKTLIFYAIGLPQKSIGPLTGGILFFIWPALGGKWW